MTSIAERDLLAGGLLGQHFVDGFGVGKPGTVR
jgi:hypothetical protein